MKKYLFLSLALLNVMFVMAQQVRETPSTPIKVDYIIFTIMGLLLFVLVLLVYILQKVVNLLKVESDSVVYPVVEERNFWEKALSLKPLSAEKEVELDHDFDGIRELNNPIPFWFNVLFYGTIIVGIMYLFAYHVFDAPLQAKEYETELVKAEEDKQAYIKKAGSLVDENNVILLTDVAKFSEGAAIYTSKCAVCHGDNGEGKVGPNLVDEYWLHGGDIKSVFKTIKYGVPSKGMVAWQNSFNGGQMQQIASYILSLQGTNPEGAKEPQGEKIVADSVEVLTTDSSVVR